MAAATAIGLRASDLPGFTVNRNFYKNKVDPVATALARCLGVPPPSQALADERSDYYIGRRTGNGFVAFDTEVLVRPTLDAVTRDRAALRKPTGSPCLQRSIAIELQRGLPNAALRNMHLTLTAVPLAGTDANYRLSTTTNVSIDLGGPFPGYVVVRVFAVQHVEVTLAMFGLLAPIPVSDETRLSNLLISRALAHRV